MLPNLAGKFDTVSDLSDDMRGLYRIAAMKSPAEVIEAVAERSEKGETLTLAEVKKMDRAARTWTLTRPKWRGARTTAHFQRRAISDRRQRGAGASG